MGLLANWSAKRVEWLRLFLGRFVIVPSSRDLVLKWADVMVAARQAGVESRLPTPGSRQRLCYTMRRS